MAIEFDYTCESPRFREVRILADDDGAGILIIDPVTDDEIPWLEFSFRERMRIRQQVDDWAVHLKNMKDDRTLLEEEQAGRDNDVIRSLNDLNSWNK